jgi:hypothetical protein
MFREYKCGCIVSHYTGRVRICGLHAIAPGSSDGRGGVEHVPLKGKTKLYPAHGEMVRNWSGR